MPASVLMRAFPNFRETRFLRLLFEISRERLPACLPSLSFIISIYSSHQCILSALLSCYSITEASWLLASIALYPKPSSFVLTNVPDLSRRLLTLSTPIIQSAITTAAASHLHSSVIRTEHWPVLLLPSQTSVFDRWVLVVLNQSPPRRFSR